MSYLNVHGSTFAFFKSGDGPTSTLLTVDEAVSTGGSQKTRGWLTNGGF